jgi:putative endonuclease
MFYAYIIADKEKRLYTGFCSDLKQRLGQHNRGEVAFTSPFRPWALVYCEKFENKQDAISRKKQLKGWCRQKKIYSNTVIQPNFKKCFSFAEAFFILG